MTCADCGRDRPWNDEHFPMGFLTMNKRDLQCVDCLRQPPTPWRMRRALIRDIYEANRQRGVGRIRSLCRAVTLEHVAERGRRNGYL